MIETRTLNRRYLRKNWCWVSQKCIACVTKSMNTNKCIVLVCHNCFSVEAVLDIFKG